MPRRTLVIAASTVAALLIPTAAQADTTVVSTTSVPAPLTLGARGIACEGALGDPTNSFDSFVPGPPTPPTGIGSLDLNIPGHVEADLAELVAGAKTVSQLTTFGAGTYLSTGPAHQVVLEADSEPDSSHLVYSAVVEVSTPGSWQSIDLAGAPSMFIVTRNNDTQAITNVTTGSWNDYVSAHGSLGLHTIEIEAQNCDNTATDISTTGSDFYVDDVRVGFDGATTTYDFEPPTIAFTAHANPPKITAGHSVTLSSLVTAADQPDGNDTVQLWAKLAGATGFHLVAASVATNGNGVATVVEKPMVTTSYQWRYPGGYPQTTATVTVKVATAVTVALSKHTVKPGQRFAASGRVLPRHAIQKVTVWAKHGRHKTKLGTTRAHKNGSYRLTGKLRKTGRYRIYAVAHADSTNTAGRSVARKLRVR